MKFKVVDFRVYRELTGQALFPADATDEYIELVLRRTATFEVERWDLEDWESECITIAPVDLPAITCDRNNSFFQKDTTFVADLKNKWLASPDDTEWWIATEEEKTEEKENTEVEANQLPLFDLSFKAIS